MGIIDKVKQSATPDLALLKPKGAGHDVYTNRVRQDWQAVIKAHPESFDALLHKPKPDDLSVPDAGGALFETVNDHVDDIQYLDPVVVSVVESSGDDDSFLTSLGGDDSMGFGESGLMTVRISDFEVPEGAIIEFLVSLADGAVQRQWWYVHHSSAVGSPAVGFIHYCIPCGDIESVNPPAPDLPAIEPDLPVNEPDLPVSEPDLPVSEPHLSAIEPHLSAIEPEAYIDGDSPKDTSGALFSFT